MAICQVMVARILWRIISHLNHRPLLNVCLVIRKLLGLRLHCISSQVVVKSTNVYPKDAEAPPCGVDDMTRLAYLHEPGVLYNLRSRYDINEIYVSSALFFRRSENLVLFFFLFS